MKKVSVIIPVYNAEALHGVSGMVSRNLIGALRFDETLSFGEDTLFKCCLFRKKVYIAYSPGQWYYYRINRQSLCHHVDFIIGDDNFNRTVRIRDSEYQEGTTRYALIWETILSCQFRNRYEFCKKSGSKDRCRQIKSSAHQECEHPLSHMSVPFGRSEHHSEVFGGNKYGAAYNRLLETFSKSGMGALQQNAPC